MRDDIVDREWLARQYRAYLAEQSDDDEPTLSDPYDDFEPPRPRRQV